MNKLDDSDAYGILKEYGIPLASFILAKNADDAVSFAEKTGYPIFLKIDAQIVHKAKFGCVRRVCNAKTVEKAYYDIMENARKVTNKINGVIVQELIEGKEVIVGAKRDPQFGTIIMFGTGGVTANVLKDVAFRMSPLSKNDVEGMVTETKAYLAFEELSSKKVLGSVSSIISSVADIMEDDPKIKEIDVNPVFISEDRVVAADVRFIL
ncbi:MAG: acetate--CoA ligase family protein [Candidatus Aenigmatarchaeota archaeon]